MSERLIKTFVWSRNIRFFHWTNVLSMSLLVAIGLVIFNSKTLGISVDGKILLKTLHVIIGYVFALNLILRITLGFIGKGYERWSKTLPFFKGFAEDLHAYKNNKNKAFKGHNPAGKLMVAALLSLMSIQMISGLVLAGTDIYYPPFGGYFVMNIAEDFSKLTDIKPYSKENVNEVAYKAMRDFRKPFMTAHEYAFYLLLLLIPLHIFGVIVAERRTKASLTSAMIHGYKYLADDDQTNQ